MIIFYNICVIFLKSILQFVGCVYIGSLYKNFCWLIQLFGIACLKTIDSNDRVSCKNLKDIYKIFNKI